MHYHKLKWNQWTQTQTQWTCKLRTNFWKSRYISELVLSSCQKKRWHFHSSKGSSFKDLIKTLSFINKLKKFILPHPLKLKLLLLLILSHLIHLLFVNTKYFSSLKSTIICVIVNSEQWTFLHHEVSFWLKFGQNYKLSLRALDVFHLNSSLTTFACTSHN